MTVTEIFGQVSISIEILPDSNGANFVGYWCPKEKLNEKIYAYASLNGLLEFYVRFNDDPPQAYQISEKEYIALKQYLKTLKNYKSSEEELLIPLIPRKIINPIFELEIIE